MRLRRRIFGAAVAAFLLAIGGTTARGDFLTNLSVVQDTVPGGLFRYTYTLTNLASSTEAVSLFQLDVSTDANLQSITNTLGWDVTYSPGSPNITWTSAILPNFTTNDLAPGASGVFSFQTVRSPTAQPYLLVGNNPAGPFSGSNEGMISGPSAVPEPSSASLLALGAAGVLVARRRVARTAR